LEQPLFSADHKLILPEGTHVDGSVVVAKKAGWSIVAAVCGLISRIWNWPEMATLLVPPQTSAPSQTPQVQEKKRLQIRTQGTLAAAEGDTGPLKVDHEGGVQATESKTRFIGTAVALLVAQPQGMPITFVRPAQAGLAEQS